GLRTRGACTRSRTASRRARAQVTATAPRNRSFSPSRVRRRWLRCLASRRQPGSMTERNNRMAPSFHSGAGVGPGANGRRGQVLVKAAEALPVVVEVAAQLADPGGAEAVLLAQAHGALPHHQVFRQAAVPI